MEPGYFGRSLPDSRRYIRLIIIRPAQDPNGIVECSLWTIPLFDPETPAYVALSYVWGDASVTEEIRVNGAPLAVTTNLAALLRLLRTKYRGEIRLFADTPPMFWVDAICINQQDLIEKSAQVPLMKDIYRGAKYVFSWLGPEADGSMEALSSLRTMSEEIAKLLPDGDRFEWLRKYPMLWDPESAQAKDKTTVWESIDRLWDRPYWKRTWIFQEIVLAKNVLLMCGKATLPWDDVLRVENWVKSITGTAQHLKPSFLNTSQWLAFAFGNNLKKSNIRQIENDRKVWRYQGAMTIREIVGLRILVSSRGFLATNPRDHVYGLLGLTDVDIIPNYSKSVRDIFTETAWKYLKLYGLTQLLNLARKDDFTEKAANLLKVGKEIENDLLGNRFGIPSWVPDWGSNQYMLPSRRHFRDYTKPNPGPVTYTIDLSRPEVLSVPGIQLCTIQDIASESFGDVNIELNVRTLQLCQDILSRYQDRQYPSKIPPLQALLRLILYDEVPGRGGPLEIPSTTFFNLAATLVAFVRPQTPTETKDLAILAWRLARNAEYLPKLGLDSNESFAKTFSEQFLGPGFDPPEWKSSRDTLQLSAERFLPVFEGMSRILNRSCFFYTDDGHFGYSSVEIRIGDVLCALKGCEYPVVLRPEGEGFTFIGTCDVQGFLAEGVLNGLLKSALIIKDFNLL